jgi:plasmid stabilization system protein ParE
MLEIVQRPRAREDLKDIWRYSFTELAEAQEDKYLAEIVEGITRL